MSKHSRRRPKWLPRSVYVLGKHYRVTWVPLKAYDGMTHWEPRRIQLCNDLTDNEAFDTILHEIMHAINHEANQPDVETEVRVRATALLSVMRENTVLFKHLLG